MELDNDDEGVGAIAKPATRATEDALGILHGVVAEYLTLKLMTGKATAAEVGAAITFLKNNSITASPSTNAALAQLSQSLQERRNRKGGLTAKASAEAEEAFGALMGQSFPGMTQ